MSNATIAQSVVAYPVIGPSNQYPELPGLYVIWCNGGNGESVHWEAPAYIGQTKNFRKRILQHRYSLSRMFTDAAMVTFLPLNCPQMRKSIERWLIMKHQPWYNKALRRRR
jgi:hypothetical protein